MSADDLSDAPIGSDEAEPSEADDHEKLVKPPGALRRTAGLLAAVVAIFLLGPSISRSMSTYRAVVLEVRDDQMHLLWEDKRPNEWVDAITAKDGDIVVKEMWTWNPEVVERRPADHPMIKQYERYVRTYEGTIIKIREQPRSIPVALVRLDDGSRITVELFDELGAAELGMRVVKHVNTWQPELTEEKLPEASLGGELGPFPGEPEKKDAPGEGGGAQEP